MLRSGKFWKGRSRYFISDSATLIVTTGLSASLGGLGGTLPLSAGELWAVVFKPKWPNYTFCGT